MVWAIGWYAWRSDMSPKKLYVFATTRMGSKKLNACIWFFLHIIFNLNKKQCYSQITRDDTHMHRYTSIQQFFGQPSPYFLFFALILPFYVAQPLFLLASKTSFFCSWCEYPSTLVPGLLSTVLPLLLHPPQGTPQIKLHICIDDISNGSRPVWHSRHQLQCSQNYAPKN